MNAICSGHDRCGQARAVALRLGWRGKIAAGWPHAIGGRIRPFAIRPVGRNRHLGRPARRLCAHRPQNGEAARHRASGEQKVTFTHGSVPPTTDRTVPRYRHSAAFPRRGGPLIRSSSQPWARALDT